jgi:hypothetical protein
VRERGRGCRASVQYVRCRNAAFNRNSGKWHAPIERGRYVVASQPTKPKGKNLMALEIVKDNEKLVIVGDGWKWFYRRVPSSMHRKFMNRNTNNKGVTDWNTVGRDMLVYATLGWEGFKNAGVDIPFTPENVELVVEGLPSTTAQKFIEACNDEAAERLAGELGNSPGTHASNPTTTG